MKKRYIGVGPGYMWQQFNNWWHEPGVIILEQAYGKQSSVLLKSCIVDELCLPVKMQENNFGADVKAS